MLLIADNLLAEYWNGIKNNKLDENINAKLYTVSDTSLSYRQTNDLDTNNLLDNDRKNKSGWRKFSFKELVYIQIIAELKKFGIKREQLHELWEAFFQEPGEKNKKAPELRTRFIGEIVIGCALGRIEMTLIVNHQGNIIFSDPINSLLFLNTEPQILISTNKIVNELLTKMGKNPIPIKYDLQSLVVENSFRNKKESELLKIIRNKNYSAIRVNKKNGDIAVVYAEKTTNQNDITSEELEKLFAEKDFMNISIVQRNGKIVSYKVEETIKL